MIQAEKYKAWTFIIKFICISWSDCCGKGIRHQQQIFKAEYGSWHPGCKKNHKGLQNSTKSKTKFFELNKNLIKTAKGAALKWNRKKQLILKEKNYFCRYRQGAIKVTPIVKGNLNARKEVSRLHRTVWEKERCVICGEVAHLKKKEGWK